MPITILSWGGIGDTLRNLGLVPHRFLYRKFGIRCRVVYRDWRKTGALEHARPPEMEFYRELIARVPSLAWGGEVDRHPPLGRALNKALRETVKRLNGNSARYFPTRFELSPEERAALPAEESQRLTIGIQTHLSGMTTKQWGMENWRLYLEGLRKARPDAQIILFDSDPRAAELCFAPGIADTRHLNIAQSIEAIRRLDFVVSIDSWSKYAAAWNGVPQLVVVPDQRPEYPVLTAEKLVREEFSGILGVPGNTVLGLSGTPGSASLTLGTLAGLSPGRLLEETLDALRGVRPRSSPPGPA